MNSLTKKFNQSFLLFVCFIFLMAVFWLYQKHTVGNDSTISEWIINYQGGLTRRGLIGEICFQLAVFLDLKLRFVIFLFQSFLYLIYTIVIYKFIKNVPKNTLTIIAIFSPIFLLYPVAEIEVLARKEIFLYVGFIIFLNLSNVKYSNNVSLIYIFFMYPILCLIWEPFIFFFLFSIYIILIRNNNDSLKTITIKILFSFSSSILITGIILFKLYNQHVLTLDQHMLMEDSLMSNFGERCYMSCALLVSKPSIQDQFIYTYNLLSIEVIFRYLVILIIGFSALSILIYNTKVKNKVIFVNNHIYKFILFKNISITFVILLLPTFILFASMTDWGRTVNMTYTFSILTYLYLIKNELIIVDKKILIFDDFYHHKKKLFIFLFVIFAFGWNQKTGMTGDIATNSLYKIIYNTSKNIFKFESIRLFQDNPIIKFHKNYIE